MSSSPSEAEQFQQLDRLIRERPTPHTEASIYRTAIDGANRETRERLRKRRGAVIFSTID